MRGSGYLHISQLFLLLPVPHRQDVIVGIVHGAEEAASVLGNTHSSHKKTTHPPHVRRDAALLTDLEKETQVTALSNTPIPSTCSVLRLTESQTRM